MPCEYIHHPTSDSRGCRRAIARREFKHDFCLSSRDDETRMFSTPASNRASPGVIDSRNQLAAKPGFSAAAWDRQPQNIRRFFLAGQRRHECFLEQQQTAALTCPPCAQFRRPARLVLVSLPPPLVSSPWDWTCPQTESLRHMGSPRRYHAQRCALSIPMQSMR